MTVTKITSAFRPFHGFPSPPTSALITPCPDDQLQKTNKQTVSMYKKLFFSLLLRFSKLDTILKSNIKLLLLIMNFFVYN